MIHRDVYLQCDVSAFERPDACHHRPNEALFRVSDLQLRNSGAYYPATLGRRNLDFAMIRYAYTEGLSVMLALFPMSP